MITKPLLKSFFFKNLSLHYDLTGFNSSFSYGEEDSQQGLMVACNIDTDFFNGSTDIDSKKVIWKLWKGKSIPFCFDDTDEKEILAIKDGKVYIQYDIIASAFYFLSGWSERVNREKDMLGRSSFKGSIIEKLGIWDLPVVNYYYDIFLEALGLMGVKEVKPMLPSNNNTFSVLLTHDIDTCTTGWAIESWNSLKRKEFKNTGKILLRRLQGRDPWFNFKEIHNIESHFDALSTWFFLAKKGRDGSWKNADYHISSKKVQKEMAFLREAGHEIAVHGSFGTHINTEKMSEDINRIGYEVLGNRFHFLMFDNDRTIPVLEQNGIKYDCTLGFADHIGFRRGVCYPFYLFNFDESQISEILEFPLLIMDTTLDHARYMSLSPDEAMDPISKLLNEVIKFNGVFSLLWHNTYFAPFKYRGWGAVYQQILAKCRERNAWMTSAKSLYMHYLKFEKDI